MATPEERVSIVLPFYLSRGFLSEAIESVLAQDYGAWWLFLVNDGSDADDVRTAKRFCAHDPERILFLEHPGAERRGTSAARNLGLKQAGLRRARGEWVAFLDADDVWLPHKLRRQLAIAERYPEANLIYASAQRWRSWNGGHDSETAVNIDGFGSDCVAPGAALLATYLRDEAQTPCPSSVLIRHSVLAECGYFEEEFPGLYDDQVLYAKVCEAGAVYGSSECLARYRQHADSCCRQAEAAGIGMSERARFLEWLHNRQQSARGRKDAGARSNDHSETGKAGALK